MEHLSIDLYPRGAPLFSRDTGRRVEDLTATKMSGHRSRLVLTP